MLHIVFLNSFVDFYSFVQIITFCLCFLLCRRLRCLWRPQHAERSHLRDSACGRPWLLPRVQSKRGAADPECPRTGGGQTASEVEALNSLSADYSVAKSLDCGERSEYCKELAVQLKFPVLNHHPKVRFTLVKTPAHTFMVTFVGID